MKSFKHPLSHYVISRCYLVAISVMLQFFLFHEAIAQDRGNTSAQEYGDAVYRYLNIAGYDYNHTAIFSGIDSVHEGKVRQALGAGYTTFEGYFYDEFTSYGTGYYGGGGLGLVLVIVLILVLLGKL